MNGLLKGLPTLCPRMVDNLGTPGRYLVSAWTTSHVGTDPLLQQYVSAVLLGAQLSDTYRPNFLADLNAGITSVSKRYDSFEHAWQAITRLHVSCMGDIPQRASRVNIERGQHLFPDGTMSRPGHVVKSEWIHPVIEGTSDGDVVIKTLQQFGDSSLIPSVLGYKVTKWFPGMDEADKAQKEMLLLLHHMSFLEM